MWVKGGIIGAICLVIILFILSLLAQHCYGPNLKDCDRFGNTTGKGDCIIEHLESCSNYLDPIHYLTIFPVFLILTIFGWSYNQILSMPPFYTVILSLLNGIILGFLVGAGIVLIINGFKKENGKKRK